MDLFEFLNEDVEEPPIILDKKKSAKTRLKQTKEVRIINGGPHTVVLENGKIIKDLGPLKRSSITPVIIDNAAISSDVVSKNMEMKDYEELEIEVDMSKDAKDKVLNVEVEKVEKDVKPIVKPVVKTEKVKTEGEVVKETKIKQEIVDKEEEIEEAKEEVAKGRVTRVELEELKLELKELKAELHKNRSAIDGEREQRIEDKKELKGVFKRGILQTLGDWGN